MEIIPLKENLTYRNHLKYIKHYVTLIINDKM